MRIRLTMDVIELSLVHDDGSAVLLDLSRLAQTTVPIPGPEQPPPGPSPDHPPDDTTLDQVDIMTVEVVGGSPDVRSYTRTSVVTSIEFHRNDFQLRHTKENTWPEVTPPGWDGGIQWTLWPVVKSRDGRWLTTGAIEFWRGRRGVDGPFSNALKDWFYYTDMPQPKPGEQVGFFATAGDQRRKDVPSVHERSNIVLVTIPHDDEGVFTF